MAEDKKENQKRNQGWISLKTKVPNISEVISIPIGGFYDFAA